MNELKRKKFTLSLLLALSLGALTLLASGLSGLRFREGKPLNILDWFLAQLDTAIPPDSLGIREGPAGSFVLQETGDLILQLVILSFWLIVIFSIVYAFISPEFRKEFFRGLMLILLVVWLLPLIAENFSQIPDPMEGAGELPGAYSFGEATLPEPPLFVRDPPVWLFYMVNGLLLMLLSGGGYYLWRRLRPKSEAQSVVVKEIRRALSELESGMALKNVVITCYAKMCQGLENRRLINRHEAMTPREFETHLAKAGIASVHIRQLTELFEQARYGAKSPDRATEAEAIRCLEAILEVYGD